MNKEQFLAKCPVVRATYTTPEGLVCNADVILLNHVHAAFEDTRATDCTCQCGYNCAAVPGSSTHFCVNQECDSYRVEIMNPNGHRE